MSDVDPLISHLYSFFDLTGVLLYGIIGGTIARHRQFDLVGFTFLALFTALGGGMVRDSLMQTGTAAAIAQPAYLILAVTGAMISLLIYLKGKPWGTIQSPCRRGGDGSVGRDGGHQGFELRHASPVCSFPRSADRCGWRHDSRRRHRGNPVDLRRRHAVRSPRDGQRYNHGGFSFFRRLRSGHDHRPIPRCWIGHR